ncbi:ABC1 kinase family protein [Tahibacter amnicola]|uniref:AarF/UbiB family protein n=1 Tax=Tahibacter amnicola TaxID=2976241 RepID=A0ABY6B8T4_9GAMM|nr:AarF/UbiB family protein [Tahibacter amnicola]UXI66488.1 AarF/UbiB family protein [Tahibacter amnicola]
MDERVTAMDASTAGERGGAWSRTARLTRFVIKHRALAGLIGEHQDATHDAPGAEAFVADLQALGPAFIKIGQTLSTRPDLLPPDYRLALEKLQDDVDVVPFAQIRQLVESELGVRLTKAFSRFDEEPLAAASLAQVHAAQLRDGTEVAVKVQRPHIAEEIATDLKILSHLADAADRCTEHGRRVRFKQWIAEMSDTLKEELDYRLEAENLRVFAAHLSEHRNLVVPRVYGDLSSARVLTMERIRGAKVSQAIALRRLDQPLGDRATELIRGYLDQVFVHGLVHADPHPGNVMIDDFGRIALVDLGMVARLGPRMRTALMKVLFAAVEGDDDQVADECASISERLAMFDEVVWRRRCGRLIGRYATQEPGHGISEGQLLIELTRVGIESGLRPPPEMGLLGKTLLNLDNVARLLDPEIAVRDIVRRHMASLVRGRVGSAFRPAALMTRSVDLLELLQDFPRQARAILENIARNRVRVRLAGLEESRLLENLQKIANRISAGIITAGLIIGAALALRVDAGTRLWGYPALALVMFVGAFCLGAVLVVSAMLTDRHVSPYRARKP